MPGSRLSPDVVGERAIDRWMAIEMKGIRDGIVTQPKPLFELLAMDEPAATTRGGSPHPFAREMLERFQAALPPLARRRLRLPVTFYVESDLQDQAYLTDEAAIELLRALGEVPATLDVREGRLWLAHARARDISERWRNAFQFSYL